MKFSWRQLLAGTFILLVIGIQIAYWMQPWDMQDFIAMRDVLLEYIKMYPVVSSCIYILLYMLSIFFGIPISFTVIAGYFFGIVQGILISVIGTFLGVACLVSFVRYLARDWVQKRYKDVLKPLNKELKEYGIHYIIMVHAIPFAPSFLPYIAMALSNISIPKIMLANIIGTLPLTIVYVTAGAYIHELNSVESVIFYGALFGGVLAVMLGIALLYRRFVMKRS